MIIPENRDDLSRFLVHLTRDYDGYRARRNLINILRKKCIEARNSHCLVMHKLEQNGFSNRLKSKFNTVCFTETPLMQIRQLTKEAEGRKIKLKPYGLIFWKDYLFEDGASPAIYINAKGSSISKFLLDEFDSIFRKIKTFKNLKKAEQEHYSNIINYYSLINVVNDKHDFSWEREWRHHGNFKFDFDDIVAIIAKDPSRFESSCKRQLSPQNFRELEKLPIINPEWGFEQLLEELAISTWQKMSNKK